MQREATAPFIFLFCWCNNIKNQLMRQLRIQYLYHSHLLDIYSELLAQIDFMVLLKNALNSCSFQKTRAGLDRLLKIFQLYAEWQNRPALIAYNTSLRRQKHENIRKKDTVRTYISIPKINYIFFIDMKILSRSCFPQMSSVRFTPKFSWDGNTRPERVVFSDNQSSASSFQRRLFVNFFSSLWKPLVLYMITWTHLVLSPPAQTIWQAHSETRLQQIHVHIFFRLN